MSPPPVAYIYMDRTSDWLDERSRSQSSSDTPRASATEAKTELKTSSLRRSPKMALSDAFEISAKRSLSDQ
jgi:hypothetical protein